MNDNKPVINFSYHARYKEELVKCAFAMNTTLQYSQVVGASHFDGYLTDLNEERKFSDEDQRVFAYVEVKGFRRKFDVDKEEPVYGSRNISKMIKDAKQREALAIFAAVFSDAVMFGMADECLRQNNNEPPEDIHASTCSSEVYNETYVSDSLSLKPEFLYRLDNLPCLQGGRHCCHKNDRPFVHYLTSKNEQLWGSDCFDDHSNRIRSLLPSKHPFVYPPFAMEPGVKKKVPTKPESLHSYLHDKMFTL